MESRGEEGVFLQVSECFLRTRVSLSVLCIWFSLLLVILFLSARTAPGLL